jgi:hypothetical protein
MIGHWLIVNWFNRFKSKFVEKAKEVKKWSHCNFDLKSHA